MQFQIGETMWGKVQGYPYWPCTISYDLPEQQKFRVKFFGDGQEGELKHSDLKKFEEHFEQYCISAKRNFQLRQSIEQAINLETHKHLVSLYEKIFKPNHKNSDKPKQQQPQQQQEIKIQKQQSRKIDVFVQKHFKDLTTDQVNQIIKICDDNMKKVVKAIKSFSSLQSGVANKIFNIQVFQKYYESLNQQENESIIQSIPKIYEIKIFF